MCRAIQFSLVFVIIFIFVAVSMGQDAFDQTAAQIKTLETKLEENRQRIEKIREQGESKIAEFRKSHKLNAPKDMFESDADYDARIVQLDALVEKRHDALRERYFEDMQHSVGEIRNQIAYLYQRIFPTNDVTVTLGTYDANNEFFPITFEINLNEEKRSWESHLNIKKDDARILYHNLDKAIKIAYISIDPEYRRALAMVKLEYEPIWRDGVTWTFHEVYDLGDNNNVAFSPDGKYLATDRTIWKVSSGKMIHQFEVGRNVNAISFSPDGKYFAIGDTRNVTLWEVNNGKKVWQRQNSYLYQESVFSNWKTAWVRFYAVSFSPDGKYIATGDTRNVTLWSVSDGKSVWQQQESHRYQAFGHRQANWASFYAVSFSPNGKYLATGSSHPGGVMVHRKAVLWQVNSSRKIRQMGHSGGVRAVSFSSDGKYLATGDTRNVILWEVNSGTKVQEMEYGGSVNAATFSPDGQYLAVGGSDKAIVFYRIPKNITIETKGTREKVIRASSVVIDLAWSPYGNLISDGKKVYRTLLQTEIIGKTVKSVVHDKP